MPLPPASLQPGTRCELEIAGLGHQAQGVGRLGEQVVFVPGALPGERVQVRLQHRARRHWLAQLEGIERTSPDRVRPPCILAERCGGCAVQHLAPSAQHGWKQELVQEALRRIGHLDPVVEPLLVAEPELGYRNRAVIPLERLPDGTLRAGYYRRGSHRIVNMNHCPVLDSRLDALIEPLKADLQASGWPVDRDCRHGGGLRHLALRLGTATGEILITLISSHDRLPDLQALAQCWLDRWPAVVGVGLNLQPRASNVLFGAETRVVVGRGWLEERFAGLQLQLAADTFFQVHRPQAERVVPLLLEALQGRPPGQLVDAYCGVGTYSLPIAAAGWQVIGLEVNPAAVALAGINAERNGLQQRCRFLAGDVAERIRDHLPGCEALFVDPPRRGLERQVVESIVAQAPPWLAYLSCDPASLARDLEQLVAQGPYRLLRVQPLDFFPHTSHVEVLALLER